MKNMRMYDLIMKKRNGGALSKAEIYFMVEGYTKGEIPDYQMSAMMMAVYFVGMNLSSHHGYGSQRRDVGFIGN